MDRISYDKSECFEMDLALKIEASLKPFDQSNERDKKAYEDWEYLNRCCLMIMRYHMDKLIACYHKL